ncbi:hypothetical protein V865_007971 [Kwoniella europaea PYCC6329]|uniref:3'-5' exonuclease domain-containing protein n=1 Tax=Kwoniella europaea PYCC6329 TaxID=1423913 RepID=A0AAX4KVL7_9TREE
MKVIVPLSAGRTKQTITSITTRQRVHLNRPKVPIQSTSITPTDLFSAPWQMSSSSWKTSHSLILNRGVHGILSRRHYSGSPISNVSDKLSSSEMASSSKNVVTPNKNITNTAKVIDLDLDLGIGVWEGKAVFTKEPLTVRSIRSNTFETPTSTKDQKPSGSSTSPILISSTPSPSPQTLSRPRAVPHYTSPLPRTTPTPIKQTLTELPPGQLIGSSQTHPSKPIHPFFNRTRTAPPTSQPRYTAQYSSTEAGSTQQSESQDSTSSSSRAPSTVDYNRDKELDLLAEEVGKLHFGYGHPPKPKSKSNPAPAPARSQSNENKQSKSPGQDMTTTTSDTKTSSGVSFKVISNDGKLQSRSHSHKPLDSPLFHYDQYSPKPQIAYTNSIEEANDLLGCLKGDILGFDLEWPPAGTYKISQPDGTTKNVKIGMTWDEKKGGYVFGQGRTALMQFADERLVVLVHLGEKMDIPPKAIEILRSPTIYKLGVQVRGDGQKLLRDFPQHFTSTSSSDIGIKGLLELSFLARGVDPIGTGPGNSLIGLSRLAERYLGKRLDKSLDVRKGNWFERLDQKQKDYAANDVYASLQIYKSLRRIAEDNEFEVDLNRYLSNVDNSAPVTRLSPTDKGEKMSGSQIQLGERIALLAEGVKSPSPAQLGALNDFVKGMSIEKSAEQKGIKVATVEGYICSALQIIGLDFLMEQERKRLWDEIPRNTYTWKRNKELYKVLKKEFDPDAISGSESETDNIP